MKRKQALDESSGLRLSYKTVFGYLGGIVVVVGGGSFALTKLSTSSHVAALQTELGAAKEREKRKDAELRNLTASGTRATSTFVAGVALPDTTLAAAGDSDMTKLAVRILDLEKEKATLLAELAKRSQDALDPKSELANLLGQLSADSPDAREDAVRGLFDLADPRAFNSLVAYFRTNPEEATSANPLGTWCESLFAWDNKGGVGFMIQQLQSARSFNAAWAYDILSDQPLSPELLRHAILQLQSVALRSPHTVARARAKLLLQRFGERLENPEANPDRRTIRSILNDIEAEVKKLTQNLDKVEETNSLDSATAAPSAVRQSE